MVAGVFASDTFSFSVLLFLIALPFSFLALFTLRVVFFCHSMQFFALESYTFHPSIRRLSAVPFIVLRRFGVKGVTIVSVQTKAISVHDGALL